MDNTDSTETNGQVPTPAEVAAKTTASTAEKSATAPDTFDRGYAEKLRKEVAGYRSKLKGLEPLAAEYRKQQDASKSELEKAQERIAGLEAALRP